jgi:hypothetical protein
MSGANNNAYAESKRLILGVGDIYLDGVFVGNLKGKVEFHFKREYARQRAGNNIADQKAEVISEEAGLTAEVCDLKLSQLRRAFGIATAVDASTAKTIEKRQVVLAAALGSGTVLAETPAGIGSTRPSKVMSMDRKTAYVSGTDYKFSGTSFELLSGGSMTPGSYYSVEYPFSDSGANSLTVGGETSAPQTFRMDYVIRDDAGKSWQLTFYKAFADTDFKMAFNDRESGDFTTHNVGFSALVDLTKPEGSNLFEITQEDATA